MRFRFFPAALLLVLLTAGCTEGPAGSLPLEVFEDGRAQVLARVDSGRALRIEREPFDSVMTQPMIMELRLADPREAAEVRRGDKIRFDLVLDQDYFLRDIETLPPSTRLRLSPDSATTDSAAADSPPMDSSS